MKVKVMGSTPDYLLKSFLLYQTLFGQNFPKAAIVYCWIYTSFSKTLYLACADDDSRRKSDLIPFVYTATTTIYSNATLKLCPSVVFSSHHPTINPICFRLCKLSTNHNPALQFDFKGFFRIEVFHSWTLTDSVHISEGHSNISLFLVT